MRLPRLIQRKRRCAYHGCSVTTIYASGLCPHHHQYVQQGEPAP